MEIGANDQKLIGYVPQGTVMTGCTLNGAYCLFCTVGQASESDIWVVNHFNSSLTIDVTIYYQKV